MKDGGFMHANNMPPTKEKNMLHKVLNTKEKKLIERIHSKAFDMIGTKVLADSAGHMIRAMEIADGTKEIVAYRGHIATNEDDTVDRAASEYIGILRECSTINDVDDYFDGLDEILTDSVGCYHADWLDAVKWEACTALAEYILAHDTAKVPDGLIEDLKDCKSIW